MDAPKFEPIDKFEYDTVDTVVSESKFDVDTTNEAELLEYLRQMKMTGTLVKTWNINTGGVTRTSLVLTQKTVKRDLFDRTQDL